jgi:hypothetical protein
MCGTPKAPKDNSLELEKMQQEERARNAAKEEQRLATEKTEKTTAFNTGLANAQNSARTRLNQQFGSYGVDPQQFASLIDSSIADQTALVPQLDASPGSYFSDDWVGSVLSNARNQQRNQYVGQASQQFAPGFADKYFGSNSDDSIIEEVLGGQRAGIISSLDSARARGSLTDTGYNAAMQRVNNDTAAGRATANTLGQGVLDRYREGLSTIGSDARNAAASYDFNTPFDIGTYNNRFQTTLNNYNSQLGGDIRTALQGQQFYDIGDILTDAGVRQGAVNPRTENAGILASRQQTRNSNRGLGGSGVF